MSLHGPPAWRSVLSEQIRSVGLMSRVAAASLLAVFTGAAAIGVWTAFDVRAWNLEHPHTLRTIALGFEPESAIVLAGLALVVPFFFWQDEGPARRAYHWAMPVTRAPHAIAKVIAGWCWLMVATLIFVCGAALMADLAERITGIPQLHAYAFPAWSWLVPFTAASVSYLFSSAAVVGARRPIAWMFGVVAAYAAVVSACATLGYRDALQHLSIIVARGEFSLATALGQVRHVNADTGITESLLVGWIGATAIWGAVGAVLVAAVALRHTEPT